MSTQIQIRSLHLISSEGKFLGFFPLCANLICLGLFVISVKIVILYSKVCVESFVDWFYAMSSGVSGLDGLPGEKGSRGFDASPGSKGTPGEPGSSGLPGK